MTPADIKRRLADIRLTVPDRIRSWLSAEAGSRILRERQAQAIAGGYVGANTKKRTIGGWRPGGGSADADILPDLPELRNRSRDLARNNPIGGGVINLTVTKTVGTGLSCRPTVKREVLGWDEQTARDWQTTTRLEFESWAESKNCDLSRRLSFYAMQSVVMRSTLESGDIFINTPNKPREDSYYQLALQMIEADRVCNPNGAIDSDDRAGGIRFDSDGAPISAWVLNKHPGALQPGAVTDGQEIQFYATSGRRRVLHVMDQRRPGQSRGVPMLAPVIEIIKQCGTYTDAEISAAVVSGLFAVFIKSEGGISALESAVTGNTQPGGDSDKGAWNGELSSGLVAELGAGESIEVANPGRPNTAFDPFMLAMYRQIGMALEIPMEVLIKHFTASYTAARAALLEAWQFIRGRREWLSVEFCHPVYELWLAEAVALGRVDAPGFFSDPLMRWAYSGAEWVGDGLGVLDPSKELDAARGRVELGISTREKESLAYDGSDWLANHEQLALEESMRRQDGLPPTTSAAKPAAAAPVQNPDLPEGP